jgi:hypothetical protein
VAAAGGFPLKEPPGAMIACFSRSGLKRSFAFPQLSRQRGTGRRPAYFIRLTFQIPLIFL